MSLRRNDLLHAYRRMLLIRRFDERAASEYAAKAIPGIVHCYIGQEAIAVGVCSALRPDDRIVSTHRGHGHMIAKGADVNRMMAELFGRSNGYCKGKGGSMHVADFGLGVLGANGIVGASMPIATGAALACHLEGQGRVAVAFFGDGASNEGTFHESLNLAAIWKLPAVFVCENNLWAVEVPAAYALSVPNVAERAQGYGIPGVVADGNDLEAVHEAALEAVERARSGGGPTLLECKTYRHRTHAESGAGQPDRRPREEMEYWLARDPLSLMARQLLELGVATGETLEEMDQEAQEQVERAVAFARASPLPRPEDALEDVFAR
ncbi:MAG: thiamine pyrophosphate-dependent dehydrogenase E1 component subunit alpha [Chloroflexi bacterium]|nr:thiamine pyrophosphate-dependent dehydrogenase E1 component subunit alpha [Chloroflexota bacterium]